MALFSCPKCAWRVKITEQDLGKKGKCMQCAHEFVFPNALPKNAPVVEEKPAQAPAASKAPREQPWLKWVILAFCLILVSGGVVVFALGVRSPPKTTVVGKVTYNSQPLTGGSINFVGADGFGQASIEKDGSYQMVDPPTGPVKASVRSMSISLQKKDKGDKMKWVTKSLIPTKFNDPERSGLRYTIRSGQQEIHIDLKD